MALKKQLKMKCMIIYNVLLNNEANMCAICIIQLLFINFGLTVIYHTGIVERFNSVVKQIPHDRKNENEIETSINNLYFFTKNQCFLCLLI